MELITLFDLLGIAVFSVSGATVAIKKQLDLFGIYLLACITAMGGGILRDVIMQLGVPVFFSSYKAIAIIFIVTTITIILREKLNKLGSIIFFLDAVGLAVFAIDTGVKAIELGYNFPSVVFMGVITAVGGGATRDILCQRVPVILRREIYATAALFGVVILWFLYPHMSKAISMYTSIAVVVVLRYVTYFKQIHLPSLDYRESEKELL